MKVLPYTVEEAQRIAAGRAGNMFSSLRLLATAEKLAEFRKFAEDGLVDRSAIVAGEDAAVLALCIQHGYGAVMDSAARQWRARDPVGAFTTGHCVGTLQHALGLKVGAR